jgi:hypothetical protein
MSLLKQSEQQSLFYNDDRQQISGARKEAEALFRPKPKLIEPSDGVSRFRRSWLEVEMAVLHTDDGNEVRAGRSQTLKEEELS